MTPPDPCQGPLRGLPILDLSNVIAGPWASTLLADLGAEVLKVEPPGARDGLRALAPHKDGVPLWWKVTNRNKRGITLYGIESVMAPLPRRQLAWSRLAADFDCARFESMVHTIDLPAAIPAAADLPAGKVRGRLVVDVNGAAA